MAGIEHFTQRAKRALYFAQKEAERIDGSRIGTEHLLVGLLMSEGSNAAKVLSGLSVSPERIREINQKIAFDEVTQSVPEGGEKLTLELQQLLQKVISNGFENQQPYITTENLLLTMVDLPESRAAKILKYMGITPDQIRDEMRNLTSESSSQKQAPPPPEFAQVSASRSQAKNAKDRNESPLMDQMAIDLTARASAGKLDPVIGRKNEIERVIQILARRSKNNPALIGEPGVGKTAIVEGLAQAVVSGNVPAQLLNKRVLQLDVGSLVAGTMYRGQFEERMKRIIDELKKTKAVLFIDEIHMLVGAGSAGSAVDAANILKPALSRGEIQVIGATTIEEYRKNIEKDAALERRFQSVLVSEPTEEESVAILKGIRQKYEDHHQLTISDEAIESAVKFSKRYISERFLPDKAIDLIDEASSRVRMYKSPIANASNDLIAELREVRKNLLISGESNDAAHTEELQKKAAELEKRIEMVNSTWDRAVCPTVTTDDVAEVVSMWTGIPTVQMKDSESERLLRMEDELGKMIIGQDEALSTIARAIRRSRSGLKDPKRPIGSFLFLGPTGVGKTELTKALAKFLFGSEDSLVQLDMSEFMERHNASRLTGAPPGYVGYDEPGQLTEAVRRRPYSIVVFDEIDKANPEVHNMLLQIMEEGHLTDSRGKKVDFRNTIIVMTSNIGAEVIRRQSNFGFDLISDNSNSEKNNYDDMKKKLMEKLKKAFRPEFLNRIDNVVVFRMLNLDDMTHITELEFNKVRERLSEQGISLELSEDALEKLTRDGFDPEMGARPLRRVIQQEVEDPLSEAILGHKFTEGDTIRFTLDSDGKINLRSVEQIPTFN